MPSTFTGLMPGNERNGWLSIVLIGCCRKGGQPRKVVQHQATLCCTKNCRTNSPPTTHRQMPMPCREFKGVAYWEIHMSDSRDMRRTRSSALPFYTCRLYILIHQQPYQAPSPTHQRRIKFFGAARWPRSSELRYDRENSPCHF